MSSIVTINMDKDPLLEILRESQEWRGEVSTFLEEIKKTSDNNKKLRAKANAIFKQENAKLRERLTRLKIENEELHKKLKTFEKIHSK
jgi:regulator of replication initiation timing